MLLLSLRQNAYGRAAFSSADTGECTAIAQLMVEKSVQYCTNGVCQKSYLWNLLEIYPMDCWGKVDPLVPMSYSKELLQARGSQLQHLCLSQILQITMNMLDHRFCVVEQLASQPKLAAVFFCLILHSKLEIPQVIFQVGQSVACSYVVYVVFKIHKRPSLCLFLFFSHGSVS